MLAVLVRKAADNVSLHNVLATVLSNASKENISREATLVLSEADGGTLLGLARL